MIEVDFTKSLAEITKSLADIIQIEEPTQAAYHAQNMENTLEKTIKEADVKCKTKKTAGLDKSVADVKSEVATTQQASN